MTATRRDPRSLPARWTERQGPASGTRIKVLKETHGGRVMDVEVNPR